MGGYLVRSDVGGSATLHGKELLQHSFTVAEVVPDYEDLCQAISLKVPFSRTDY